MPPPAPHPISFDPAATGPLAGVRVLDLSRLVAGNMLSLQLADFGADVIKVEPPSGDPLRDWRDAGRELHWKTYARNKRSIVLNLRHDGAKDALLRLVAIADVLIENFRPGTLEEIGLGPDVLQVKNPGLIIARVSGFGQTGPYAPLPGFGTLVEAMRSRAGAAAARARRHDRRPLRRLRCGDRAAST
jgi:crotonobetainyl-CoA:carnitine CoA-transferase CaiB-like acyl-CoA transferase